MEKYYHSFNDYLLKKFKARVHKISLNAGFTCPNRDGTLEVLGCVFCNEKGFSHFVNTKLPLYEQIETSMKFFRKRFNAEKFIAYFQNATNTYASVSKLKHAYDVIKLYPDIVGLSISTRPDCIDEKKLDLIESYSNDYDVWIEYGLQTIHDATLNKINRSHTFSHSLEAIRQTAKRNIKIGVHVILGLPGESRTDMIETAKAIANLPIAGVKLHILHILKNTELERLLNKHEVKLLGQNEYVEIVCDFLERLSLKCVVLRLVSDAKDDMLVAPKWVNQKQKIIEKIKDEFKRRGTKQGSRYEEKESMCIR